MNVPNKDILEIVGNKLSIEVKIKDQELSQFDQAIKKLVSKPKNK